MKKSRETTLMQLQVSLPTKILVTMGIMLVLIVFVYYCNVPNPNMILIAGLVFCSALFGFGGGLVAAVIMVCYTLFFFSTDHSFIHFTPENMQKVAVTLIGVIADMLLVCLLKETGGDRGRFFVSNEEYLMPKLGTDPMTFQSHLS